MNDSLQSIISDSTSREQALTKLWSLRGEFEKDNKLLEFEKLEKEIVETPVVNLIIAFDPKLEEVLEIVGFVRKMLEKAVFIEVKVDQALLAGCILIWQGKVYDFSLQRTITSKKEEFRKMVYQILSI